MKWLLLLLGALVAVIAIIALIGAFLPRAHVATCATTFHRSPAEVYALIRDFAQASSWRSGVKSVELLPPRDGRTCFRETTRHGAITYLVLEDRPAEKLVLKIADENLPFGGSWTYEFAPAADGTSTTLRITENGEVKNVIFRFLSRFVFGHAATIDAYLRDIGHRLDEADAPPP